MKLVVAGQHAHTVVFLVHVKADCAHVVLALGQQVWSAAWMRAANWARDGPCAKKCALLMQ